MTANDKVMRAQEMSRRNGRTGLTIWDLFNRPLNSLGDYMPMMRQPQSLDMKTDIREEADRYVLSIDVPGANKEDLQLDFADGVLSVQLNRKSETTEQNEQQGYVLRERSSGSTVRRFSFADVDDGGIDASLEQGVLQIFLKKKAQAQKKSIEIK